VEDNPTRVCGLIVGLSDVDVLGVVDAPGGALAVHIRTRRHPACGSCDGSARSKGSAAVSLVDLAAFGRPVRLVWHKRRWQCRTKSCGVGSFTEVAEQIAPARSALTSRAGRWATVAVGRDGRAGSDVAAELGCDWHTVNRAVTAQGQALLDADAARVGDVEALGLDETLFARRDRVWCTSIVDTTGSQLLDAVPDRDAAAATAWIAARLEEQREGVAWGCDISGTGHAADPFHAVRHPPPPPAETRSARVVLTVPGGRNSRGVVSDSLIGWRSPSSQQPEGCCVLPSPRRRLDTVAAVTVSVLSWFKLDRACEMTRDLIAKNPLTPDVSSDYMAVQAWPFVVALYSGIEQALKSLLLAQPNPRVTLDELRSRRWGHDLEKLYAALPADDREHVELHFREHWSLYEYATHGRAICSAEDFVAHINRGGEQGGQVSWRYVLVDATVEIPATSLWTMCEIWRAVCCRVKTLASGTQGDCSRLSRMLASKFRRLVLHAKPTPYDEFIDEINEWTVHREGDQFAAWIDLLVKAHHNALGEVQATERLRSELAGMAHKALNQMASEPADPDETQLIHRIRSDPDLTWDRTTATFRSAPTPRTTT